MDILERATSVLEDFTDIQFAVAFGSVAHDQAVAGSDLDIAVAAQCELSMNRKYEIIQALEDSCGIEIDLVDLQVVSGVILQQALCTGTVLLKKSTILHAGLLKKMWYNQEDVMPMVRKTWEKR
ncbi:MAG: nucleotidyltransferase domain-containing protein, partial [Pseudomonadota bacterium]|nr:nucleotidyltransferase domain-containing protein [Pseudomonadota bacterium]